MSAYKKLTEAQKKEIAKPIDHAALCQAIRKKHGETMRFVRDKYQGDAKAIWVDKGV